MFAQSDPLALAIDHIDAANVELQAHLCLDALGQHHRPHTHMKNASPLVPRLQRIQGLQSDAKDVQGLVNVR